MPPKRTLSPSAPQGHQFRDIKAGKVIISSGGRKGGNGKRRQAGSGGSGGSGGGGGRGRQASGRDGEREPAPALEPERDIGGNVGSGPNQQMSHRQRELSLKALGRGVPSDLLKLNYTAEDLAAVEVMREQAREKLELQEFRRWRDEQQQRQQPQQQPPPPPMPPLPPPNQHPQHQHNQHQHQHQQQAASVPLPGSPRARSTGKPTANGVSVAECNGADKIMG